MSHVQNLQHAVMAAKAGNPSLARVHLHRAAEQAPGDPAIWLWMGWLAESPTSMVQCLEAAMQDERHRNIAQAGLAFARALNAWQVPDGQSDATVAIGCPADPVTKVEQLAAAVSQAGDGQGIAAATDSLSAWAGQPAGDAWDPNGLEPPPLPPMEPSMEPPGTEVPPRGSDWSAAAEWAARVLSSESEPSVMDGRAAMAPVDAVPSTAVPEITNAAAPRPQTPPVEPLPQIEMPARQQPQHRQELPPPVWRAAHTDWFTVDGGPAIETAATPPLSAHSPAGADRSMPAAVTPWQQIVPADADAVQARVAPSADAGPANESQADSGSPSHVRPAHPDAAVSGSSSTTLGSRTDPLACRPGDAGGVPPAGDEPASAAAQLDAELARRRHQAPGAELDGGSESDDVQPAMEPSGSDFRLPAEAAGAAPPPQAASDAGPWRPTGLADRMTPVYGTTEDCHEVPPLTEQQDVAVEVGGSVFEGEPVRPARHPRTVLVVDDSPTVRKLVAMTLEKNGYHVVSAYDGVAAIREIAEHNPALILMDVNMPRMDGYQLCRLVRKHEATRHIPVLMLSGKDGVFDRIRGKMVGCSGYVPKPFVPEELVQTIGEYIGSVAR